MAGYSGVPLEKKLGIKEGYKILLINIPENYFSLFDKKLTNLDIHTEISSNDFDFIHCFETSEKEYKKILPKLKNIIKKNGMIWISWPKKASKIETDLNEYVIRDYALEVGLVDVKVCAVDEVWTGLKLVYRLKDR